VLSQSPNQNVIEIVIGDYLSFMTGQTKEVTKAKLRNFLFIIRNVLTKILQHNQKPAE